MGVMATFNTTLNKDALPLSPKQKFQLFFRSATDPWPFLLNGFVAGIGQAKDSNPDWGQGMQGYAKRFGSGYSDYFIGNFFGNALLPSLLHEDPRYFQKGTGSVGSRILWAAGGSVWCKRDKGGWGPNYANVAGNLIGTAIARVYYPPRRPQCPRYSDGWIDSDGRRRHRVRAHRILAGYCPPLQAQARREAGPAGGSTARAKHRAARFPADPCGTGKEPLESTSARALG